MVLITFPLPSLKDSNFVLGKKVSIRSHEALTFGYSILENTYDGPDHDAEVYAFSEPLRDQLVATSGFGTLRTYINYAFGDEGPEIWYGNKSLPRLVDLKKRWDPLAKFGPGNPIPLSL